MLSVVTKLFKQVHSYSYRVKFDSFRVKFDSEMGSAGSWLFPSQNDSDIRVKSEWHGFRVTLNDPDWCQMWLGSGSTIWNDSAFFLITWTNPGRICQGKLSRGNITRALGCIWRKVYNWNYLTKQGANLSLFMCMILLNMYMNKLKLTPWFVIISIVHLPSKINTPHTSCNPGSTIPWQIRPICLAKCET